MKNKLNLFYIVFIFTIAISIATFSLADEPIIYSGAAILIDSNNGDILYEKNANNLMYPASTTKILTAIVAIENCSLDEKIVASESAISAIKSGYTNANIQIGEELTMEQLLYALLLNSANEAANVIAERVGGSIENFANMMNAKAIELGCRSTHFVNANGIHSDEHYTTASDLATIARYCMQNETFRKMVSTLEYQLPATEQYPSTDRILKNSNSLLKSENNFYYPYAIGIKTGFTTQAKNCLVSASNKDGLELISVVLHAEATEDGRSARYLDTINLLEYGNTNYKSCTILDKNQIVNTIDISNASEDSKKLNIVAKERLAITLPNSEEMRIESSKININDNLEAPIESGTVIGTANYLVNGKVFETDLIAESNVKLPVKEENNYQLKYFNIVYIFLGLALIRIILYFFNKNIKNEKWYLNP